MNRDDMLARIEEATTTWDILVVGGGATGLGVAVDAASRGYRTLLIESHDFAHGTSSRSTKLIHGGVRYLQQGHVGLVLEALKERTRLRRNAPHLVHDLPFVVPAYGRFEALYYGLGLHLYDALAGGHGLGVSRHLLRAETLEQVPTVEPEGLHGGTLYHDAQFDDARLAIDLAKTAVEHGATVLNYVEAVALRKSRGRVHGVVVQDRETGAEHELCARVVVNATGPFADRLRRLDDPDTPPLIAPSQGAHIVLDRAFLPGHAALLIPRTDDRRVLFAIPWHERVLVGTTDTPLDEAPEEPKPHPEEVEFLLTHAARYLARDPTPADVLSAFAGIRPLLAGPPARTTATLPRDHTVLVSVGGLVTVAGGKWTTYRRMAEDAVNRATALAELERRPCVTRDLPIHGGDGDAGPLGALAIYGSDASPVEDLLREDPRYGQPLHAALPTRAGEAVWAVRHEMARTLEDFLARRTRCLLLNAQASIEAAPAAARLMAEALGRNETWQREQVEVYARLAARYVYP